MFKIIGSEIEAEVTVKPNASKMPCGNPNMLKKANKLAIFHISSPSVKKV